MIRQSNLAATMPATVLLLLVAWAPIPFGSVLPSDRGLIQIGAFVALALLLVDPDRRSARALRSVAAPAMALAAIGVLGFLQTLPMPLVIARLLSPRGTQVWQDTIALLGDGSAATPFSMAPAVTRATAVHWLAMAAVLLVAAALGAHRGARRLLGGAIAVGASVQVVYGADRWFRRADAIWGVQVPGDVNRLRGSFVNPDHLALFLVLAVAVTFAAGWWGLRRQTYEDELDRRLLYVAPPTLLFVMLFVGLAFTGSRAGLAVAAVTLLSQAALLAHHYRRKRLLVIGVGAVSAGLAAISFFGFQAGFGRWLDTSAYELAWNARLVAYRTTLGLWTEFPWLGTGLGTFRQALPLAQGPELAGTWTHAHNDYLELLLTTGIVGLPIMAYGVARLIVRLVEVLRSGRRSEDRAGALAALGAVVGAGLMALVDFGLTTPANALCLTVICGLAAGSSVRAPESETRPRQRRKASVDAAASPTEASSSSAP